MSEPHQYIKYPNRRLYDRIERSYVTLLEIGVVIDAGEQVVIIHSKTKADVTRDILWELLKLREIANPTPKLSVAQLMELIRQ